jgi:hypothetical protein
MNYHQKNKKIKSKYIIELKDSFYDKKNEGFCIVMELYLLNSILIPF